MAILTERVECKELLDKLMPVEEAVKFVHDRCKIAISGFTKTGEFVFWDNQYTIAFTISRSGAHEETG